MNEMSNYTNLVISAKPPIIRKIDSEVSKVVENISQEQGLKSSPVKVYFNFNIGFCYVQYYK